MFSDKKLNDVAKSVAQVMENQVKEELKGNQHKIDANKNNKVDSHDFKLLRAGKKVAKEETEHVEEGIEDKLEAARAKAKAAGKILKGPAKPAKSNVTKVAGTAYGGSAQKDEPEDDEDDEPKKASKKGVFKRRYNTKAGREAKAGIYKEQFSYLLDSYVNSGLKGIMENLEIVEVEEDQITEEASNDEYKSELSDAQAKSEGKKKADVAAASTQAVTKEDVDQVEERTLTSSEMETREKNVKGMKKNLAGFKERYGDRAKEVLYATATKQAKKGE